MVVKHRERNARKAFKRHGVYDIPDVMKYLSIFYKLIINSRNRFGELFCLFTYIWCLYVKRQKYTEEEKNCSTFKLPYLRKITFRATFDISQSESELVWSFYKEEYFPPLCTKLVLTVKAIFFYRMPKECMDLSQSTHKPWLEWRR